MRLTRTRKISQLFFLALFIFLLLKTDFRGAVRYPVTLLLEIDPLHALSVALSSRALYGGMILSLLVIVPTFFLGRFFCGWVCPLGTLNDFFSRLLGPREEKKRIEKNRYRPLFVLKYYILTVMLVLAAFGIVQIGLLDPIVLLTRSFALSLLPALSVITGGAFRALPPRTFQLAWALGLTFIAVLLLNAVIPRFFCRALCPLGALLGLFSRLSVFHVRRDREKCVHCDRCLSRCPAAADPQENLRKSECYACLECREVCPVEAVTFRAAPPASETVSAPDVSRRRILGAAITAALGYPLLRSSFRSDTHPPPGLIRPPGSLPEDEFLGRCTRCGKCMKVCPTNVIHPALLEGGLEGFLTPLLLYNHAFCAYRCTSCGTVCPTGAIRPLTMEEKLGRPPYAGPVRMGTAFVDRTRCLPWAMNTPCIVCEEVCPVSPKAIYLLKEEVVDSSGRRLKVQRPVVDPKRCIGCGMCQARCPVHDMRAIRVTSVGETRSDTNVMVLG